jgi:hypothetical protein
MIFSFIMVPNVKYKEAFVSLYFFARKAEKQHQRNNLTSKACFKGGKL